MLTRTTCALKYLRILKCLSLAHYFRMMKITSSNRQMRGEAMKNNAGETRAGQRRDDGSKVLGMESEYFFGTDMSREASAEADNTQIYTLFKSWLASFVEQKREADIMSCFTMIRRQLWQAFWLMIRIMHRLINYEQLRRKNTKYA